MPQVCTICKVLKDESEFNHIKRNYEVRLPKSCRECNLKKSVEKRRALETTYQHLWSGKIVGNLQIHGKLLMTITIIPVINVEKKNQ